MAGQLIQRGESTWLIRVYAGVVGGKRKYVNSTFHGTKREARARLNKMLVAQDTNELVMSSRLTLGEYLEQWKDKALRGRVTPRTFRTYGEDLKRYVLPPIGDKRLSAVTAWDIQSVYADLSARGLSAGTVRHVHAVLRNALKQAVKWRLISHNPADSVDLPKSDRIQKFRALTTEQVGAFLAAVDSSPWKAVYHLMLNTGMRPGEVFALTWKRVDLARCEIVVSQTVTFGPNREPVISVPKSKKSRRVTFTQELAQVLLQHREATAAIANPDDLVFPSIDGGLIHPNNWSRRDFKDALARAGLSRSVRLYDLRHSMATLALAAGIHPKVVSERLGHATTKLTLDTYSHVTPHMQDQAGQQLASLIYQQAGAEEPATVN